jgi:transposase
LSWQGLRTARIAEELGCHPKTVRKRLHRFNTDGMDGLGDRPGAGRKPRLTELERSRIITLPRTEPPGRLVRGGGGELEAFDEKRESHWTLDALTTAARDRSIVVAALTAEFMKIDPPNGRDPGRRVRSVRRSIS